MQEQLVSEYPEVGKESAVQPNGAISDVSVFGNPAQARVIKVSHRNFLIAFTRYTCFEDFKDEVVHRIEQFCTTFGIDSVARVGLRYVNEIIIPEAEASSLVKYVRPVLTFDRFPVELLEQFAVDLRSEYRNHLVTVRTALLPGALRTYVLDIDCNSNKPLLLCEYPALLDEFHDSAQRIFLDHITDEYKKLMRAEA